MQNISIIDETFNANYTSNCFLSIQVALNGFSYSILDKVTNKYVVLKHFPFNDKIHYDDFLKNVNNLLNTEELLDKIYKKSAFINVSKKSVLVPSPLLNEKHLKQHFEFNAILDELDELHYYKIKSLDSYCVFTVHQYIAASITKKIPKIKFLHHSCPYLENLLQNYKVKENEYQLFINLNTEFFDLAIISGNRLLLYNTYSFINEKDILYFLLYTIKQLDIDINKAEIILSGTVEINSRYTEALNNYIPSIKFARLNPAYTYSYMFNKIPSHIFSNLVNIDICV